MGNWELDLGQKFQQKATLLVLLIILLLHQQNKTVEFNFTFKSAQFLRFPRAMQVYRSPRLPIMYVVLFWFPKLYFEWWEVEAADNNAKWWETKYAPVALLKLRSWHRPGLGLRNRWSVLRACQTWSPRNKSFLLQNIFLLGDGAGGKRVTSKSYEHYDFYWRMQLIYQ